MLSGNTLFQKISKKNTAVRWTGTAVSKSVIAVMGIGEGVGTTHLCMMLANCMANGLKARTALVEYGVHDTGSACLSIAKETKNLSGDIHTFQYAGIDFYRNVSKTEWTKISDMNYEAVILDMKYGSKEVMTEFLRSDLKIVVAGINLWQAGRLKNFLENEKLPSSHWRCVTLGYDRKLAKRLEKEYGICIGLIPAERNPFELSSNGFLELLKLTEM